MDLGLRDKAILVSGGASGIGRAIVHQLVREGAVPCIIDKNKEATEDLVDSLQKDGNQAWYAIADLTSEKACREAVAEFRSRVPAFHGLVNNAGVNDGVSLADGSEEAFLASFKRNVTHYYSLAKACLPHIKDSGGSIVNIVSKTYTTGQGGTSAYAAANGIRASLTGDWARELGPWGIRVHAVCVAECWTPLYESWIAKRPDPESALQAITDRIPLGQRMTTAAEIADSVVFLLSGPCALASGQILYVDGGYVHLDRAKP